VLHTYRQGFEAREAACACMVPPSAPMLMFVFDSSISRVSNAHLRDPSVTIVFLWVMLPLP
jgi:hypothetical protein